MKIEKNDTTYNTIKYRCSLTKKLDDLSGLSKESCYGVFYHYILIDKTGKEKKCLAIRVPGGTVGSINYDNNNIITNIVIDTNYVINTYPDDLNKHLEEFIGEKLEQEDKRYEIFI